MGIRHFKSGLLSVFVISSLILSLSFSLNVVHAGEEVIFSDNFESYPVDSFPYAGGWEIVWSGTGQNYVTDSVSAEGTKSFQLEGLSYWSAGVKKNISWLEGSILVYELYMRVDEIKEKTSAWAGFFDEDWSPPPWDPGYRAKVSFKGGTIYPTGISYEADKWYKIRVRYDTLDNTYNVWVDDELAAEGVQVPYNPELLDSFLLISGHGATKAYFDSVKVYQKTKVPPAPPVGGTVRPVDKLALLAPWIVLAALIVIASASVAVYLNRRCRKPT
jgi:hypothetical protein